MVDINNPDRGQNEQTQNNQLPNHISTQPPNQPNTNRTANSDFRLNNWHGKPPSKHRKAGESLLIFHNVDGFPTGNPDPTSSNKDQRCRGLDIAAYVEMMQSFQADFIAAIDTRLGSTEDSQKSIVIPFLNYRDTKPTHNYTATERKPTIGEINLISHPDIKGHTQGKQFTDPRGWSRWIGIILQGPKAHVSPNGVKVHRK